jgi:hypothetical protein
MNRSAAVRISYAVARRATFIVGGLGFGLMGLAAWLDRGRELDLPRLVFEIGMVLGPIGVVGAIYEFSLRREFEKSIEELARRSSAILLVTPEERLNKLKELISGARHELIMLGNATLYDFSRSEQWLHDIFSQLRSVEIACLAESSSFVKTRDIQSGHRSNIVQELQINKSTINVLVNRNPHYVDGLFARLLGRRKKLDIFEYDIPPSEWFCISDQKTILASWYPYGSGDSAPCLYIEDATKTPEARALLRHYLKAFDFVRKNRVHKT